MIEAITACMERITSGQIDKALITVNKTIKDNNVFIIDDNLCNDHYHRPTIIVNDNIVNFIMTFEQSFFYLNTACQTAIKEFNDFLMVYIDIYNKLQPEKDISTMDKYIKVTYDIHAQSYDLLFAYHNSLFMKHEDIMKKNAWSATLRAAMRRAPNLILVGELSDTDSALLLMNTKNMILFPVTNNNLIYSSSGKELNHCFIEKDGLYKETELFKAIQSYLNLTESDNCNILDPNLIKNKIHFDNLLTLHKIIKF